MLTIDAHDIIHLIPKFVSERISRQRYCSLWTPHQHTHMYLLNILF